MKQLPISSTTPMPKSNKFKPSLTSLGSFMNNNGNSEPKMHAHFDCFSGAAGDMLLAACIDASPNPSELLTQVKFHLDSIPELKGEFDLVMKRVLRGSGCIGALKVDVKSIYDHKSAPVPGSNNGVNAQENHLQIHQHDHQHGHEHKHEHQHQHQHENQHDHHHEHKNDAQNSSHSHKHQHQHENGEKGHGHKHSNSRDHESHETDDSNKNHNHSHTHDHGHSHGHSHGHDHSSDGPLRNLPQIKDLISRSPLPSDIQTLSIQAFSALAKAEAHTHNSTLTEVHFHEVGAVDSIVDTVGTLIALHLLNVKTVSCSRLPMGEGTVNTSHGLLPVPAPATLRLLSGMKVCPGPPGWDDGVTGELITPTAAALLKVLTHDGKFAGRCPRMTVQSIGIGAGTKNFRKHPNILRLILGKEEEEVKKKTPVNPQLMGDETASIPFLRETSIPQNKQEVTDEPSKGNTNVNIPSTQQSYVPITNTESQPLIAFTSLSSSWNVDRLVQLEANIDDTTPEILAYTMEKLLNTKDAIDVWTQPIYMKKGRLAHMLCCLCHDESSNNNQDNESSDTAVSRLLNIIFRETTTLGIRIQRNIERAALHRTFIRVPIMADQKTDVLSQHTVNVKIGFMLKNNNEDEAGTVKEVVTVSPEFEDCKQVAMQTGMPLKDVMEKARYLAMNHLKIESDLRTNHMDDESNNNRNELKDIH